MRSVLFFTIVVTVMISSCIPQRKQTYLQDKKSVGDELKLRETEYRLKPNDILSVRVMTTNTEMNELFNIAKRFGLAQFPYAAFFTAISTAILLINFFN